MSEQHTPPTEAELDEATELTAHAWRVLGEACARGNMRMSVPVNANDDDEVLSRVLRSHERLIAEVRRLRAQRSAVWLIEHIRGANGAPLWWCGSIPPFSADPNSAVRFVRERDAHVVMVQENIQNSCRATEHVFIDAAPQGRTP